MIAPSRFCALGVIVGLVLHLGLGWAGLPAEERFPPPEFSTTHHELPAPTRPAPRETLWSAIDVAVLTGLLGLAAWLVYRRRSRRGVFIVSIVSIAYFGFWREGCVCPIGSIQNVAQAAADPAWVLPLGVLAFFFLPLLATLLFGRIYCSSVCPHGALQDAVVIRPLMLPRWLDDALGLLPWFYLGLAVLLAATGAAYVICEYDPFIALFRLSGSLPMLLVGGLFLVLSLFIGRPYCRFLCPYGAMLRLLSQLSHWRIKIYPDRCIDCRLCDSSCPHGAIRPTTPSGPSEPLPISRRRLAMMLLLLPVLVAGAGWGVSQLAGPLSRMHPAVQRAEAVLAAPATSLATSPAEQLTRDRIQSVRQAGESPDTVRAAGAAVLGRFERGAWLLGAWIGLVVGLKAIALALPRRRSEYEADRAKCVACARCFDYCPGEKGLLDPAIAMRTYRV